ncbi:XkdF-like putative serine protease domain-containing protein [Sphingobacterium daejeonense]|uniref:XkdF-like putative serine protease domain-containing protein n=1 Tax=Sphingobacterium daejeonense TaxID=371142 RepID=UPI0010C3E24B|nr:XkdF-like putative serine protease domain-containing protein [Sphingobacterium daejeonense]VTP97752.1 Uncharacterised protein [Sphingobacterium daejeonense]
MPIKELPVYECVINPAEGMIVDFVSIVETPAVATNNKKVFGDGNFLAFKKDEPVKEKMFFSTDEKQIIFGIAMMAGDHIYRRDEETGKEFYVTFTKEMIYEIVTTFFQKSLNHNMNVDHTSKSAKSYIFQSILVDEAMGIKAPEVFGEVSDGSWLICAKVNDPELWQEIKQGKKRGFSVEGMFQMIDRDVWVEVETDEKFNKVDIDITGWALHDTQIKASINQLEYYINKLKED